MIIDAWYDEIGYMYFKFNNGEEKCFSPLCLSSFDINTELESLIKQLPILNINCSQCNESFNTKFRYTNKFICMRCQTMNTVDNEIFATLGYKQL